MANIYVIFMIDFSFSRVIIKCLFNKVMVYRPHFLENF